MSTLLVRGINVDTRWIIANAVYIAILLCLWPFNLIMSYRVHTLRRSTPTVRALKVRWTYMNVITTCLTVAAIDVNNVLFDWFRPVNAFFFNQWAIVITSLCLDTLFSHVDTFLATNGRHFASADRFLAKARVSWMAIHWIGGETVVVVTLALRRAFLYSLLYQVMALEALVVGPVLLVMVYFVTKSVEEMTQLANLSGVQTMRKKPSYLTKFQQWGIISGLIAILLGIMVSAFLSRGFRISKDIPYSSLDGWGNRNHASEFAPVSFFYSKWACLAASAYIVCGRFMSDYPATSKDQNPAMGSRNSKRLSNSRSSRTKASSLKPRLSTNRTVTRSQDKQVSVVKVIPTTDEPEQV